MNTAKELAQIHNVRLAVVAAIKSARHWAIPSKYTDAKLSRKYARDAVKSARKANHKLVALLAAGSARPVSIIMAALLPRIEEVRQQAIVIAQQEIDEVTKKLELANYDIRRFAPVPSYPKGHASRAEFAKYKDAVAYNSYVLRLTKPLNKAPEGYVSQEESENLRSIRSMDAEGCEALVRDYVRGAEGSFFAYVEKLEGKVGEIVSASIDAKFVWSGSTLTVVTAAGETVKWFTQMIWNRSCLGKVFPQFPTRKVK